MPTTSNGFPYPTLNDPPNGPAQIQALAQEVNKLVQRETTITGATSASGWSVIRFEAVRDAQTATIMIMFERTGSTIEAEHNGNIPDTDMGTLPAGYRPPFSVNAIAGDGFGNGECSISPGGVIALRSWLPNGVITSGRNIRVTSHYHLP